MLKGSCLCGAVRYQYHAEITEVMACHCLECRKAHGTPFATNAPILVEHFELLTGQDALKSYESSAGKYRVFCHYCGSPIYSRLDKLPNVLRLRVGTLETPLPLPREGVDCHIFVGDKANWWQINDGAPQYLYWKDS